MKLRVSVVLPRGGTDDITLSCDVTATVADTARALLRSGLGTSAELREIARRRLAPVTLRAAPGVGSQFFTLDPMTSIGASGLRSGWLIEPVPEFSTTSGRNRIIDVAGFLVVMNGEQAKAQFSLVAGTNIIGRDAACRVQLLDRSVSRRHAQIQIDRSGIVLTDLGSANGIILDGARVDAETPISITKVTTVGIGDLEVQIYPGPPPSQSPARLGHRVMHTRSPRVAPSFPSSERKLPAAPGPAQPGRIPILAMFAPMLMGGAMYAITQSPLSLMMVAFTPMMMIGSWLDGRLGGRRKLKREIANFAKDLDLERKELRMLRDAEIEVRAAETPTAQEIDAAIGQRDSLLWTRRPEHRSFLEVRFGEGALPSRTGAVLPDRGESLREHWEMLQQLASDFEEVSPVPVIERLERCGSIGVAGEAFWAEGMATSLVLQLVGLHSPYELALACFAGPRHDSPWAWLKWLPHVDPVGSPLPVWQLADSERSSTRLLVALEGLLETRRGTARAGQSIRSHLDQQTRNDHEQGEAVTELPVLPAVVVLVLEDGFADPARLIELAEHGPDFGIHIIWVAPHRDALPAACRTFVEVGQGGGRAHFVRSSTIVPLSRIEHVEEVTAQRLARMLAPVEDLAARVLDESDLPKTVNLREIHGTDLLGGAAPILQSWNRTGSLVSSWVRGQERGEIPLSAVIGQGPEGPVEIDLRAHGPHALVGGTTGAGKSEFLQSWIMSLAANVSPDRLTFLLVDYKGGAAFAECVDLPHTVGLVTDLSPHLVHRALASLRAELRYREELLAEHGAKDLISMERRSDPAAPPVLVIVIDEFAALASDVPEFVDGVIDIAQRGRSLGLHLVMATQRPAGVIKDNLRANTNLRVALRMADEADSSDVIGVKDAAFFDAETPGRGAIKVGPGRISHFQTGYLGGRASNAPLSANIEVRSLGFVEGEPWVIPAEERPTHRGDAPDRDIERLRDAIIAAAEHTGIPMPRRPWLDELPGVLSLRALESREGARVSAFAEPVADDAAALGLRDDPAAQAQTVAVIDFEEAGSVSFSGAGGTGKTSALITLAASLSGDANGHPVQIYGIDAAGGALTCLASLPTVGAVAPLTDTELMGRVLRRVRDIILQRGPRYANVHAASLSAYRREAAAELESRVFLLIDGFAAFRAATETLGGTESPMQLLSEILMNGRAVGVHVVLTSDRPAAIPAAMASNLQQRYVLRLASSSDYASADVKNEALEAGPPGRAVLAGDGRELQIALIAEDADLAAQSAEIEALADGLRRAGVAQVQQVVNAPELIPLAELPAVAGLASRPVYGIDTRTFEPVTMPTQGLGVIAGPSGSGLSEAALCCVEAFDRAAEAADGGIDSVLLTFVADGLRNRRDWGLVAEGADDVAQSAARLVEALGGKPVTRPGLLGAGAIGSGIGGAVEDPPQSQAEPLVFPTGGRPGVIIVERPAESEGTAALGALAALAKTARRSGVLVLFEFESGSGASIWDLYQALKQPQWGLALQPDQQETQTPFREDLGRVRRADFPPGRGFAIERGRSTPIHVAAPSDPG